MGRARSGGGRGAEGSLALPAAERVVLLILTGSIWGPRVAFLALLGWGALATAYVLTARIVGLRDTAAYALRADPAVADRGAITFGAPAVQAGRAGGAASRGQAPPRPCHRG